MRTTKPNKRCQLTLGSRPKTRPPAQLSQPTFLQQLFYRRSKGQSLPRMNCCKSQIKEKVLGIFLFMDNPTPINVVIIIDNSSVVVLFLLNSSFRRSFTERVMTATARVANTPEAYRGSVTLAFGWDETKQRYQKSHTFVDKISENQPDQPLAEDAEQQLVRFCRGQQPTKSKAIPVQICLNNCTMRTLNSKTNLFNFRRQDR